MILYRGVSKFMGLLTSFLARCIILDLKALQSQLGISFNDQKLVIQAFTHSSYVNEHQDKQLKDNERLEFLGDAVLELAVSKHIFHKYQLMAEGEMTQLRSSLVCEPSLAKIAIDLHFDRYLRLGKGEEKTGGRQRPSILADTFEAFLGALYLDKGFDTVVCFLKTHMFPRIKDGVYSYTMDYKSELQELIQRYVGSVISYDIVAEKGPAHARKFIAVVTIKDLLKATGQGHSKKEAEQRAAKKALEHIEVINNEIHFRQSKQ